MDMRRNRRPFIESDAVGAKSALPGGRWIRRAHAFQGSVRSKWLASPT